jgi:hypothetical protein
VQVRLQLQLQWQQAGTRAQGPAQPNGRAGGSGQVTLLRSLVRQHPSAQPVFLAQPEPVGAAQTQDVDELAIETKKPRSAYRNCARRY